MLAMGYLLDLRLVLGDEGAEVCRKTSFTLVLEIILRKRKVNALTNSVPAVAVTQREQK